MMLGTGRDYGLRKVFPSGFCKYLDNGSKLETCFYNYAFQT